VRPDNVANLHCKLSLLRARRERPRGRAAEQPDELAPFHSITSSASASSLMARFCFSIRLGFVPAVKPGVNLCTMNSATTGP
jgi:hypothetical protein